LRKIASQHSSNRSASVIKLEEPLRFQIRHRKPGNNRVGRRFDVSCWSTLAA